MFFNFKNKNTIIILLLILLLISLLSFSLIQNNIEGFGAANYSSKMGTYKDKFTYLNSDSNISFFRLKDNYVVSENVILTSPNSVDVSKSDLTFKNSNVLDVSYNVYQVIDNSNIRLHNYKNSLTNDVAIIDLSSTSQSDLSGTIQMLFKFDASGKLLDLSDNKLNINLYLDNKQVIENGKLREQTEPLSPTLGIDRSDLTALADLFDLDIDVTTAAASSESASPLTSRRRKSFLRDYLLSSTGVSSGLGLSSMMSNNDYYNAPLYNSFEGIMSNPSNPIVNPLNSMNPLQYSQTLFGPNITPSMVQNICKNSNLNNNSSANSEISNNALSNEQNVFQNSLGSSNYNNTNNENNANNANNANCENCENCNNKHPNGLCPMINENNYEDGYEKQVPRPILTNFSSFGM